MAHTAHSNARLLQEVIDSRKEMKEKVKFFASILRTVQNVVVVSGAGISTACGIRDYRSGPATCLPTGVGVWTEKSMQLASAAAASATTAAARPPPPPPKGKRAKRKASPAAAAEVDLNTPETLPAVDEYDAQFDKAVLSAVPSFTHCALVELHRAGKLSCVLTQNCDNLHALSGLPPSALVELHGNSVVEECVRCERVYRADAIVVSPPRHQRLTTGQVARRRLAHLARVDPSHPLVAGLDPAALAAATDDSLADPAIDASLASGDPFSSHYTGRFCPDAACHGELFDNVIEFQDTLFDEDVRRATQAIKKADLILLLGTSLVVDPLRKLVYDHLYKRTVQINLQLTVLDPYMGISIHGRMDDVFRMLMAEMQIKVPHDPFIMTRIVCVEQRVRSGGGASGELEIRVRGLTEAQDDADSVAFIQNVSFALPAECLSPSSAAKLLRGGRAVLPSAPPFFLSSQRVEPITGTHELVLCSTAASGGVTRATRSSTTSAADSTQEAIGGVAKLMLHFAAHKGEPPVELAIDLQANQRAFVTLSFDCSARRWMPINAPLQWSPLTSAVAGSKRRRLQA